MMHVIKHFIPAPGHLLKACLYAVFLFLFFFPIQGGGFLFGFGLVSFVRGDLLPSRVGGTQESLLQILGQLGWTVQC